MKKYGLLVYKSCYNKHINIGDYIQSLAARQYLPKVDYLVDRDTISEFNEDFIDIIMNGWFMLNYNFWPPSDKIKPLFISFHINEHAKKVLIDSKSIQYLSHYQPIGCRDINTMKLLKEKGLDAYFSGCLTLTLDKKYKLTKSEERNGLFFVDPIFDMGLIKRTNHILLFYNFVRYFKLAKKISKALFYSKSILLILRSSKFLCEYSKLFTYKELKNAVYINHEPPENLYLLEQSRFDLAENLISQYQSAKLVVTSRIHCALPCLALNTPFYYIDNLDSNEISRCRMEGIIDFFPNIIKVKNGKIMNLNIFKESYKMPQSHLPHKENLKFKCERFINE